jgi:hypothetical protein
MRLDYALRLGVHSEGILFGLARKESAVHASSFPNDAVENENRYPALLPLNYVPDLPNSSVVDQPVRERKGRGQLAGGGGPPS